MKTHSARVAGAVLVLSLALPLAGGGRRRAVAVSNPADDLSITIVQVTVPGADALLDAGAISSRPGARGGSAPASVYRTFAIRIGSPSQQARGNAVLRAFLDMPAAGIVVRVDGIALGPTARVIDPRSPVGVPSTHRLEIEVPPDVPEGALALTVGWEATRQ